MRCWRPAKRRGTIAALLNREIVALLQAPDVKERYAEEGSTIVASTPAQLVEPPRGRNREVAQARERGEHPAGRDALNGVMSDEL